eukprot:GHVR01169399.1.p1 GENE.GHVR01169399.1~~GHVR01169399.1.p1  ORF type:complete len:101 (+),score=10.67 GHVR01169399.1:363-665(+)
MKMYCGFKTMFPWNQVECLLRSVSWKSVENTRTKRILWDGIYLSVIENFIHVDCILKRMIIVDRKDQIVTVTYVKNGRYNETVKIFIDAVVYEWLLIFVK